MSYQMLHQKHTFLIFLYLMAIIFVISSFVVLIFLIRSLIHVGHILHLHPFKIQLIISHFPHTYIKWSQSHSQLVTPGLKCVLISWVLHPAFPYIQQQCIPKKTNCLTLPLLHLTTSKNLNSTTVNTHLHFYPELFIQLLGNDPPLHLLPPCFFNTNCILHNHSNSSLINTNRHLNFHIWLLLYFF